MEPITIEIVDGLAPAPVWEPHKRGRNWLAVCAGRNAANVSRTFHTPVYSERAYDPEAFEPGAVVEIAADYTNSSGRKSPCRVYGIVRERTPERIVIDQYATLAKAMSARV